MRTEDPQTIRLEDYRVPDWLIDRVELDMRLHATATRVTATLHLRPNPQGASPAPLVLDGDELTLLGLHLDDKPLPAENFDVAPERLTIAHPPNGPFRLRIETELDPSANTRLMGLYRSNATYCTQCEADGFRRIMYFLDRPDIMAVYTTRIEAEQADAPVLLANGNRTVAGAVAGTTRHFAVWHDPFPKPSYLFAMVGGDLACVEDRFVTASGRPVTLQIFVEHGREHLCGYAMDALKRAMAWDESAFGREYDLDVFMIVAVSDFNMGAMENKGLNVFNDKYVLASPETATDADYASIEAIVAHEYFHNWTGNRITCRDWFQLCLKEGLTVFRDQEFSADMRSRAVERIGDVRTLRAYQFVEDAGPLAHPVRPTRYREINNFYTTTVYEKGAEIVRMLRTLLGDAAFRAGMDMYFDRHDGRAATVEEFIACFADASGENLHPFLRWYAQAGTPQVVAHGVWDEGAATYRLDLAQTIPPTPGQPDKQPMVIPLSLGLLGRDGRDLPLVDRDGRPLRRDGVVLQEAGRSFVFTDIRERPVPSLNRGFSAPVNLVSDLTAEDTAFLAAHDEDPFNRWQAIQTLASRRLVLNAAAARTGGGLPEDPQLLLAFERGLRDPELEPAFVAQCLSLPSESDIAREIGRDVDPDAIHAARMHLRASIGRHLGDLLSSIYEAVADRSPYSPDAAGAGRRALRNVALALLAATGAPGAIARAVAQQARADNMTDRMAALAALMLHDGPERDAALDDFYERFRDDPLVVDKWFALQASIPDDSAIERLRRLTAHPAFVVTNPNRVRSLVGSFAHLNVTQFNRRDAAGYDFVAEVVLTLDPNNPQVAARLVSAFRTWRSMEPVRQAHARAALRRIADAPKLSRDVADIVGRSLADETTS